MRICLIAIGRYLNDPRACTLARSLARVGNDVVVVAVGSAPTATGADGVEVRFIPSRYPQGGGRYGKALLRRVQPGFVRRRILRRKLAAAAIGVGADIYYPTTPALVPVARAAAEATDAAVARDPRWPDAGPSDLVRLAPHQPQRSVSPAGPGGPYLTPEARREGPTPEPGRHHGRRIALCYRKTDTNPGKYLEAALIRAGATVEIHTDSLDWSTLTPNTDAVVFVEGPYPALTIRGRRLPIPTVFWVHHGEHHIPTNLRLVERYGAQAVLLAHSWHLAHRFPVPVHRFTFGVAPELVDASIPWARRRYTVAMVGGQLRRSGGTYQRRQRLVADLERSLGEERTAFVSDVTAREMAGIYANAQMIINEGGTRHYPITMRVLEAVGSGAVLITDDLPGTDLIVPRDQYVVLEDDVAAQVRRLLRAPEALEHMTAAAREYALAHHTYDHRVDDLLDIIDHLDTPLPSRIGVSRGPLAALIDDDVEVQRIAGFGLPDLATELPTREVWDGEQRLARLAPGTMEAIAIGPGGASDLPRALAAARRFIYASGQVAAVSDFVTREHPDATLQHRDGLLRVDLNAESYRVLPHERDATT
ncbi:MAG: glycosyltransferase [Acidimicrobiia bacterium]|jgi:glycosyltransferase involved in cell wall biosynthesis